MSGFRFSAKDLGCWCQGVGLRFGRFRVLGVWGLGFRV